ncbi:MAG: hypothetical protein ACRDGQ_01370 [Candidatus Limnocylindrales bacterium]
MSPQRAGSPAWWTTKGRQFRTHLRARVEPAERADLEAWVPAALLTVFDAMPVADRRHGLDVVASLRVAGGGEDHELLLAGLLHDCGKSTADGRGVGLGPRVAWSLGEALGPGVLGIARRLPGYGPALDQLADHAQRSATIVGIAGGSSRTVDLIRDQAALPGDRAGELLRRADEAN